MCVFGVCVSISKATKRQKHGTSLKVSEVPFATELKMGPLALLVFASNLMVPEGKSLVKNSLMGLASSPYLTVLLYGVSDDVFAC